MLLTAMYSEEEADVTAMKISESAFRFLRRTPSDEANQRGLRACCFRKLSSN